MDHFNYQHHELYAENVAVSAIARACKTPCYVYSRAGLEQQWHAFDDAFQLQSHLICYAVKANSNLAVLNLLARMGSGFDIVSGGELERVLLAGGEPAKIVFSGVGKGFDEIKRALQVGIRCFNVESSAELARIQAIAKDLDLIAPIALRINPNIDAKTHPYIATGLHENKFGIEINEAKHLVAQLSTYSHVHLIGLGCHLGSQITELEPFLAAIECILALKEEFNQRGIAIQQLDLGGGLGVVYREEMPPTIPDYAQMLIQKINDKNLMLVLEPGRAIIANAGILVTRVEYIKKTELKNFLIVDAAMNDLMRPALYQAWQDIIPVRYNPLEPTECYDVVGPVCETADFLGKERELAVNVGDLLVVRSAGAYGFSMSSNYNSRPRVAEVMIDKDRIQVIREREKISDLLRGEKVCDES